MKTTESKKEDNKAISSHRNLYKACIKKSQPVRYVQQLDLQFTPACF